MFGDSGGTRVVWGHPEGMGGGGLAGAGMGVPVGVRVSMYVHPRPCPSLRPFPSVPLCLSVPLAPLIPFCLSVPSHPSPSVPIPVRLSILFCPSVPFCPSDPIYACASLVRPSPSFRPGQRVSAVQCPHCRFGRGLQGGSLARLSPRSWDPPAAPFWTMATPQRFGRRR